MYLTSAETVLAIPAGVVLGALISFVGQAVSSRYDLKRSHAERLWDRRADLYVRILGITAETEKTYKGVNFLETGEERWEALTPRWESVASLMPEIVAYANDTVLLEFLIYRESDRAAQKAVALNMNVSASLDSLTAARERLTKAVRTDLRSGSGRVKDRRSRLIELRLRHKNYNTASNPESPA